MQHHYETISDLLDHQGPGLQDYVTPDELNQLIDGTLPIATIADRYLEDLGDAPIATDGDETRTDLLDWIRFEIDGAIWQRKDIAEQASLEALAELAHDEKLWLATNHRRKLDAIVKAQQAGATKDDIARNLGISRPTLNDWIRDRKDRILFNEALALLARTGAGPSELMNMLYGALGTWAIKTQAQAVLAGAQRINGSELAPEARALVHRAAERASELAQVAGLDAATD